LGHTFGAQFAVAAEKFHPPFHLPLDPVIRLHPVLALECGAIHVARPSIGQGVQDESASGAALSWRIGLTILWLEPKNNE
jgi:hypothetical protein